MNTALPTYTSTVPSPCFVLDEAKLRQNLELIDSVQKAAGVTIILALKGFSMYSAFPLVREYLSGATASSLNEIKLVNEYMGVKAHSSSRPTATKTLSTYSNAVVM